MHIIGPDDFHAAASREEAERMVHNFDAAMAAAKREPLARAVVAEWPWSAEAHAEDLPKSQAGCLMPAEGGQ
jgi:hypothetical protein